MENLNLYYYEEAGQQAGPVDARQLLAHGVKANTLVWQEGMPDWVPAATLPALAALFQPVPPPLPPRMASILPPINELGAYPPPAQGDTLTVSFLPQDQPTPLPAASGQAFASTDRHPASPALPTLRPQFSAEASTRKWWHYALYVIAFIFMWLAIRACGAILEHAITATERTLPTQTVTAGGIVGYSSAG